MIESIPHEVQVGFLRATVDGDGRPGPIEERVGRRLLRVVDPDSPEGEELLRSGSVELIGPSGESFGRVAVQEVWRRLARRLEERLSSAEPLEDPVVRDGLERLRARCRT
jgi:hypothetical protein